MAFSSSVRTPTPAKLWMPSTLYLHIRGVTEHTERHLTGHRLFGVLTTCSLYQFPLLQHVAVVETTSELDAYVD